MVINFSNVRFNYPDRFDRQVLNIPHWTVSSGEQVFIHGPSGSGKSTLLNLVSGLLTASSGHLTVLGQPLNQLTNRQRDQFRANHIGYVSQQFNLIPYLDAVDNIHLAHHFSKARRNLSLANETKRLLSVLNFAVHDRHTPACKLSIGQQQRVAIARALINKPQLLIADEPTSSLDAKNRDAFMALIMAMSAKQNITLLFVSHDLSLSDYFTRIEALHDINQIEVPD